MALDDGGATADWIVRERTTWRKDFTLQSPAGVAVDITGHTFDAVITAADDSPAPLKTFSAVIDNGAGGQFHIVIAEGAADLPAGRYFYSVEWDDGTTARALLSGWFVVKNWNQV